MGVQLFANGAAATLSGTLAQGGTTMTLAAGMGAKFPSVTGSDYFYVTLFTKDAFAVEQNIEVVKVTARTGDTLTLVRDIETMTGQSGGFAYDGNATTVYVQQRNTAKTMDNMLQKSGNLSGLADNAAARTNIGLGNVTNTSDANKPISNAQQTALDAKAPLANPTFTGTVSVPNINGAALGPKNKLINGCMRIPSPNGASGSAALGDNTVGAAGVTTVVGGFATFSGTINQLGGYQDTRTSSGALHYLAFGATTGGSGYVVYRMNISAEDALAMAGKPVTVSCRLMAAGTTPTTSWLRRYKANSYNDFSATTWLGEGPKSNTAAMSVPLDLEYTFTPTYADCVNGTQVELALEYTGVSPQNPSYVSIADFQVIEGSKRLPFEARPIELEKALVNRFRLIASPSFTGDLTLSSAGARILGDFSNATQPNRVAFQSSVLNGVTGLIAMPNGTATTSACNLFNSSDILNASVGYLNVSSTHVRFGSGTTGSGTQLPLALATSGVDRQTILPTGEVGIGVNPAVGQGTLQVQNVNGAATSGFRNKITNGCMRISRKGSGAAALGFNGFGADGINTYIGGWSAVTGNIGSQSSADSSVTSSGGTHFTNITAATGGVGYIAYIVRIEAADALELAGRPITTSARITSWTKQIDDVLINISKANTVNNFGATTLVANVAGLGPVSANTSKDVSFSTTLTTADCTNGLQIEVQCYYASAVTAAFHCFIADLQCCAGSQRMPFELRPIAIEEELRSRYYRKQSVWVGVTGARTCFPIGMVKTPTLSGGGAGFTSTGTTADTLMCYQTTAAAQTLILDAEL